MTPLALSHYVIRHCRHKDSQGERLLLDSRVLDAPRAYNLMFVTLPSLKPLFFNSHKKEWCFSDNMGT